MLSDCEQLTIANIHWQTKDVGAITNHKWIVSLQISLFPSHRKAYMYDLIARQISQLAVDRILKDNLPKTCAAANISLSTCRQSLSSQSRTYSSHGKWMGSQWLAAQLVQHLFALYWGKKSTRLSKEVLIYSDACPRGVTLHRQKYSQIKRCKTHCFHLFSIWFKWGATDKPAP